MKKISVKVNQIVQDDFDVKLISVERFECATAIATNFDGVQKLFNRKKYNVYLTKEEIKEMVTKYYIFVKGFGEVTEDNINEFIENYN